MAVLTIARIAAITSANYTAIKSRHRGVLYNHYIDGLMRGEVKLPDGVLAEVSIRPLLAS